MKSPHKEGLTWFAAAVMALPPFLLPLFNPDLFWHLSAGKWMASHGALVREEFLSFTMAGSPWSNFEWLAELAYFGIYSLAGFWGLWLAKILLLALSAGMLVAILRLYKIPTLFAAAGLVLWSVVTLAHADIRPDLFSTLFFAVVLYILERRRLGRGLRAEAALLFVLFMLWVNLHAGFAFGLMLLVFYAAADLYEGRRNDARTGLLAAGAAVAGTLINPFGLGPYKVIIAHWTEREILVSAIQEWQPTTFTNLFHLPFWPLLVLTLAVVLLRMRRKGLPLGLVAAVLLLGFEAVRHTRLGAYFKVSAIPLILFLAQTAGWLSHRRSKRVLGGTGVVYALFMLWILPKINWALPFDSRHVPVRATAFMERELSVLEGLRTYNPWEWGGYLGWKLYPRHKVFGDGRYIFHYQLDDLKEAISDASKNHEYMERLGIEAALTKNVPSRIETLKRYPDGSTKVFRRPWYLSYFPKKKWALVYWDSKALLFVDRSRVPASWLEAKEYRYIRPFDDAAFAEAMEKREIPLERVNEERERFLREKKYFDAATL